MKLFKGLIFLVLASLLSCGQNEKPNIVYIMADDLGYGDIGVQGQEIIKTPNIDKMATEGLRFTQHYSGSTVCAPSRCCLMTGLHTGHAAVRGNRAMKPEGQVPMPEGTVTIVGLLKDAGYKTAAFTGGLDYAYYFSHMRGFPAYKKAPVLSRYKENPFFTSFKATLKYSKEWLESNADKKFFLFIHGYDAHCPFTPQKGFKGVFSNSEGRNITVDNTLSLRGYEKKEEKDIYEAYYYQNFDSKKVILSKEDVDYLKDLYDEEVLFEDYLVGNFLNGLDKTLLEKTVIVIFAEHGEMFGKHGRFGRAGAVRGVLYDEVVHVPLIIKLPSCTAKRKKGFVQTIDVMPTLLKILNLSSATPMQGKNVLSSGDIKNNTNEYVFAGATYHANFFYKFKSVSESIRNKEWKLIYESRQGLNEDNEKGGPAEERYELYKLKDDPQELNNVVDTYPGVFEKLKRKLMNWSMEARSVNAENASEDLFNSEMLEGIKKHGYW